MQHGTIRKEDNDMFSTDSYGNSHNGIDYSSPQSTTTATGSKLSPRSIKIKNIQNHNNINTNGNHNGVIMTYYNSIGVNSVSPNHLKDSNGNNNNNNIFNSKSNKNGNANSSPSHKHHGKSSSQFTLAKLLLNPAFIACTFYASCSVSMTLVNKLVLTTYKFDYPMVLLMYQSVATIASLEVARHFGGIEYEPLILRKAVSWLPVDLFFVAMLLTGFYSVHLLSVPMVTIFKNMNNIFIAIGDFVLYNNISSPGVIITLILMLIAAFLAALNDLEYNFNGYMWTFANCAVSTGFVLYARHAMESTKLSTFGKVYYNNLLAIPLVLVSDVFFFGDFARLYSHVLEWGHPNGNAKISEAIQNFFSLDFVFLFLMSGVLGFFQSLSSLRAQHLTSPTTYSMVGSLNKVPLSLIGIILFSTPISAKGFLYLALSIIAGMVYSYTKAMEEQSGKTRKIAIETNNENEGPILSTIAMFNSSGILTKRHSNLEKDYLKIFGGSNSPSNRAHAQSSSSFSSEESDPEAIFIHAKENQHTPTHRRRNSNLGKAS